MLSKVNRGGEVSISTQAERQNQKLEAESPCAEHWVRKLTRHTLSRLRHTSRPVEPTSVYTGDASCFSFPSFFSFCFIFCMFILKMDKRVAARMTVVVLGKIQEYDVFALQPRALCGEADV